MSRSLEEAFVQVVEGLRIALGQSGDERLVRLESLRVRLLLGQIGVRQRHRPVLLEPNLRSTPR